MEKNVPIIKCCVCGQEYLPQEIFTANSFFPNPGEIIKNNTGKVECYLGKDADFDEEYICDNCNTPLKIKMIMDFSVEAKPVVEPTVEEEYVTTFERPAKLTLTEGELFE